MNTSEVIRARRSIRKYKENFVIPLAVIAVGKAEQNPDARGFFEPSKVTYLK